MKRRSSKILFFIVSVFISLAFVEMGLRLFLTETYFLDWHSDEFHRAKLLSDIKKYENNSLKKNRIIDNIYVDNVYDENLGWRMKPDHRFEGVTHNSKGFRSNKEYSKESSGSSIFAVGDSYTYGLGVYDKDTFTARIEKITGLEVINAGVNGYGIDQAYLMWELEGKKLDPSIVLLGYFVDDFYRNALSVSGRPKPHFLKEQRDGQFNLKWQPVPTIKELIDKDNLRINAEFRTILAIKWLKRSLIDKYGLQKYLGYSDNNGLLQRVELSDYILKKFDKSVEESGARFIVVIIGLIDKCYFGQLEYGWIEKSIVESCQKYGIEYINLAELMRENIYFPSFYARHCHFTEGGHRFAAEKIVEALNLKNVNEK